MKDGRSASISPVNLSPSVLLYLIETKWEAAAPPRLLFSGVALWWGCWTAVKSNHIHRRARSKWHVAWNFLSITRRAAFQQTVRLRHEDDGANADIKNPCRWQRNNHRKVLIFNMFFYDTGQDGPCIFFSLILDSVFSVFFSLFI